MPDASSRPAGGSGGGRHRAAPNRPSGIPRSKEARPRPAIPKQAEPRIDTNLLRPLQYTPETARRLPGKFQRGARAVVLAAAVALLCGGAYAHVAYDRLDARFATIDAVPAPGLAGVPAADIDGTAQDILITVVSADEGLKSVVVMHVPADQTRVDVISVPADAYVAVPGGGNATLSTAYRSNAHRDPVAANRLLIQAVDKLTGLQIDHVMAMDSAGLDGFLASHYRLGDCSSTDRTAAVIRRVLDEGQLLNPFKFQSLIGQLAHFVKIDPTLDLEGLSEQLAYLAPANVALTQIPNGGSAGGDSAQVVVDPASVQTFVGKLIGVDVKPPPALSPADIHLVVLNGSGSTGASTSSAETLRKAGFVVDTVGDTDPVATTVVRYGYGQRALAQLVGAAIPGAQLVQTDTVSKPTLVLGRDGDAPSSVFSAPRATTSAPATRTAADAKCVE